MDGADGLAPADRRVCTVAPGNARIEEEGTHGVVVTAGRRSWRVHRLLPPCAALLATLLLAGCSGVSVSTPSQTSRNTSAATSTSASASAQRDVAYGPLAAEKLDLCRPQGATSPRPGVILIHGGGWSAGDKRDFDQVCMYLATHGFVAATVDYRLAPTFIWPELRTVSYLTAREHP